MLLIGDQLVAKASDSYSWDSSGDRRLTITYPKVGQGALITYLHILVEQVRMFLFRFTSNVLN